jgi:hypothetical protein
MGAATILQSLADSGIFLTAHGENLHAEPRERLTEAMRASIRVHKAILHAYLRAEADQEAFEERAAIMEFDGGLSRTDAEAAARAAIYSVKE